MAISQNGWSVAPPLDNSIVPGSDGVKLAPGVRQGDAAVVLFYVASRINLLVERLVPGWCWGFAARAIRGSSTTSNHASATCFDFNAPKHVLGKRGTFTQDQRNVMLAIVRDTKNMIRFGEFYDGRVDGMHVEIVGTPEQIARLAQEIREGKLPGGVHGTDGNTVAPSVPQVLSVPAAFTPVPATPPPPVVERGCPAPAFPLKANQYFGPRDPTTNVNSISGYFSHADDLRTWQERMRFRGWTLDADGRYGPQTETVAKAFQRDKGMGADALIGPATWGAAWTSDITR